MSSDSDRRLRAERRRQRASLYRAKFGGIEPDPVPVSGPDAVSLVDRLTRESWTAAGLVFPQYPREQVPVTFAPRRLK